MRFDVGGYGGYQAIRVEMHDGQRVYVGASESRKDGMTAEHYIQKTSQRECRTQNRIIGRPCQTSDPTGPALHT